MFLYTFLRHGESIGNSEGIIQGQFDSPLSEKGRLQAQAIAVYWKYKNIKFERIIASPLSRALETAQIVSDALNSPLDEAALWKERTFGELEGYNFLAIEESFPELDFYHPYNPPAVNAESMLDLHVRATLAVKDLLSRPEKNILVVSHGAFLSMVMYVILGLSPISNRTSPKFSFDNTGFSIFIYNPNLLQWRMKKFKFNRTPGN